MTQEAWITQLRQHQAIAVIRTAKLAQGRQLARSVAIGGMRLIEITWNSDRPAQLVEQLRSDLPNCRIGAGTLLDRASVEAAIAAGAQFLFTPHTCPDLIQLAARSAIPIVPGALSPTEIVQAWQAGATSVKVFPVQALGGAAYIRSLQAPLGQIPLIPTGGVTIANAPEFIRAGAIAVGLSGSLFSAELVQQGNWDAIALQAATLIEKLEIEKLEIEKLEIEKLEFRPIRV